MVLTAVFSELPRIGALFCFKPQLIGVAGDGVYLSTQFRHITGMTVSEYRENDRRFKRPVDQLT